MTIPKIIHFLWMSDIKPKKILEYLETWKKKLDGYEIKEWNRDSFPYQNFIWTKEAFECKKYAFVSDYFRFWVLYNYGGIYLDADIVLNGNFDGFLDDKMFIGTEIISQLGPHCMGAVKGHWFIKKCLDYYENRHFIKNGISDMEPLPGIMTKIFIQEYYYNGILVNFNDTPKYFDDITIYNDTFFSIDIKNGKNVCEHFCCGSWRDSSTNPRPVLEEVLQSYFIRKYFINDFKRKPLFRKIYDLLAPGFINHIIYKRLAHIKNNKRVKRLLQSDRNNSKA